MWRLQCDEKGDWKASSTSGAPHDVLNTPAADATCLLVAVASTNKRLSFIKSVQSKTSSFNTKHVNWKGPRVSIVSTSFCSSKSTWVAIFEGIRDVRTGHEFMRQSAFELHSDASPGEMFRTASTTWILLWRIFFDSMFWSTSHFHLKPKRSFDLPQIPHLRKLTDLKQNLAFSGLGSHHCVQQLPTHRLISLIILNSPTWPSPCATEGC